MIRRFENLDTGTQLDDFTNYAVDDENDQLLFKLDAAGDEVCTIGQTDGILKLNIRPDREVNITLPYSLVQKKQTLGFNFSFHNSIQTEFTIFYRLKNNNVVD